MYYNLYVIYYIYMYTFIKLLGNYFFKKKECPPQLTVENAFYSHKLPISTSGARGKKHTKTQ